MPLCLPAEWGAPVVGCKGLSVDEKKQMFILEDGSVIRKGRLLTLEGSSGEVWKDGGYPPSMPMRIRII